MRELHAQLNAMETTQRRTPDTRDISEDKARTKEDPKEKLLPKML
jgi:hypothetical protein